MRQSALQHFLLVVQPVEPASLSNSSGTQRTNPGGAGCRVQGLPLANLAASIALPQTSSHAVSWRPQGLAWPNPNLPVALLPCEYGVESQSDAAGPPGSASRGSSYSNLPEAQLALRFLLDSFPWISNGHEVNVCTFSSARQAAVDCLFGCTAIVRDTWMPTSL